MTVASRVDYKSAPKDYAEVFGIYYKYVVNLVHQHGITDDNKEDVASDILTRFQERDSLAKFDPSMVFEYQGQVRPARFKNYLTKFALKYVLGHLERQQKLGHREVQTIDTWPGDAPRINPAPRGLDTWIDNFRPPVTSHEDCVIDKMMEEDLWQGIRDHLADVPPRSSTDRCNLVALFDAYRAQVAEHGHHNIKELTALFGVSSTAMHGWVWWMKSHIAHYIGDPLPAKRARTVKPKAVS